MENTIRILVADDSENDRWFIGRAFKQACPEVTLVFVRDGQELIEHLKNDKNERPSALVMDMYMIKMNAIDVLKRLSGGGSLGIPVIVLSSAGAGPDVDKVRKLGITAFVQKPFDLEDWARLAQDIRRYAQ
jgi:CheY-like chemotaxis protein